MISLAWGAHVSPEFRRRVMEIAAGGEIDPSWLMAVMAFETGRTFSPSVRNPTSSATGLIQFMPATAMDLGTTVGELSEMTAEQQLDWVERYLQPFFGHIRTLEDCYMAVLWPAAVGKPDDDVIFEDGQKAYLWNKGLDADGDGGVTKAEACAKVRSLLELGMQPPHVCEEAAPIEDRGQPARPEDVERINEQEETQMAPALLLGLLGSLMEIFSPVVRAKLTKVLDKQTGDSAISGQVADKVIEFAQQAAAQAMPGVAPPPVPSAAPAPSAAQPIDPVIAVGTVKANAQLAAQVEARVADYLEQIAPALDRIERLEREAWKASEDSANAAAARYAARPPDGWDMTRTLVYGMLAMMGFLLLFVAAIAGWQTYVSTAPSTEVWAAVTGLIGFATGIAVTVFAFRFGYSRQSGAKDALLSELATRR